MRLKTWSPLTMREVFALTDRPNTRLVTSAADLLAILLEILDKFAELHGAQTLCVVYGTGKEPRNISTDRRKWIF